MFKFKFVTILLMFLSLACNISILQAKLVERSSKKMPDWVGQTTENSSKFFFSGSSSGQPSFEAARKLAISDALTQIIESFDLTMSINSNRILTETQTFMEDRIKSKTSEVRVLDTKIKKVYFEKYDDEQGKITYNVHVLLSYSKKEYEKEKARLAQEYENYKQSITNRFTKAEQLITEHCYQEALFELFETLKMIDEYGICRGLEGEIIPNINNLLTKISFSNSFITTTDNSGMLAEICVSFGNEQKYSNAIFDLKTLNNFSIDSITSDENGIVNHQFNKVSYLKKSNYKLELNLQKTYDVDEDFLQKYKLKNIYEDVNFITTKKRIYVSMNTKNVQLMNLIKASLVQNGFNLVNTKEEGRFILNVDFSMGEVNESTLNVVSGDSVLFISNAHVNAELIETKDQKSMNSASFSEKGFGKTKEKSYSDLLQKISISIINIL